MSETPILDTERLILRDWREEDLNAYASLMANEEGTRYIGGIMSRSDAWRSIAAMLGHWTLRGFGLWAVVRKSDGAFIGRVGLYYPEGWPGLEVGWALARPFWGQGYATKAAKASIKFGFQKTAVPKLISLIHPDNRASQKVAERIGQSKTERTSITLFGKTHDVDVWDIKRSHWTKI